MPLAIAAFALMALIILAVLAGYAFYFWIVGILMVLAILVVLAVNLYVVRAAFVAFGLAFPWLLRFRFTTWAVSAVGWMLLGATYAFPVVLTLLLIGLDIRYFYPPLLPYEGAVIHFAGLVYGV